MTKEEKEAQQAQLEAEKKVIRELRQVYERARKDCEEKIRELGARTDVQNLQSIIYQKQYQQALKKQLDGICDILNSSQFTTIGDYLVESYYNGYIGTMYDIAAQGIPLTVPIKQEDVTRAIQVNSKIKGSLYESLGEDVKRLKNSIRAELSRGISNGSSYEEIAAKIARGMNSPFNKVYNNTLRIAKTEGHRVQQEGTYNAQVAAKKKGADVVKQWDSTLDGKTRPTHRELDGQIAEVEDLFVIPSTGNEALYPGGFGIAAEDINCRCCSLQRAKWALDMDELATLAERATYFGIDKTAELKDFKEKYLNLPRNTDKIDGVWSCKDFESLQKYLLDEYGIAMRNFTKLLDFDAVKESLIGVETIMGEFPELKQVLKFVETKEEAVMTCAGDKITFNPIHFNSKSKLMHTCRECSDSRHWIRNSSPRSLGVHEAAHAVEWILCKMNPDNEYLFQQRMAYDNCVEAKKIVQQACKNVKASQYGKGKTNDALKTEISKYAKKDDSETMAEAFADVYINGAKASPLSHEIKKLTVERYLKLSTKGEMNEG